MSYLHLIHCLSNTHLQHIQVCDNVLICASQWLTKEFQKSCYVSWSQLCSQYREYQHINCFHLHINDLSTVWERSDFYNLWCTIYTQRFTMSSQLKWFDVLTLTLWASWNSDRQKSMPGLQNAPFNQMGTNVQSV